jgi:hypothetical protein
MSIYFIRAESLVKIGYSSNLGARVRAILKGIPSQAHFLGHMPGDRELEAHLHQKFAQSRFTGEWFVESEDLLALIRIATDATLPAPDYLSGPPATRTRADADDSVKDFSVRLREVAAHRWPLMTHRERIVAAQKAMGFTHRRARSLYNADSGATLRQIEVEAFEEAFGHVANTSQSQGEATE